MISHKSLNLVELKPGCCFFPDKSIDYHLDDLLIFGSISGQVCKCLDLGRSDLVKTQANFEIQSLNSKLQNLNFKISKFEFKDQVSLPKVKPKSSPKEETLKFRPASKAKFESIPRPESQSPRVQKLGGNSELTYKSICQISNFEFKEQVSLPRSSQDLRDKLSSKTYHNSTHKDDSLILGSNNTN
ncbi:hypothetical protein Lal_00000854 [Lupinus albus]|nr:hypothetical protein Lal_00000854 [Lupinus albus]